MMTMTLQDKCVTYILVPICQNIDFFGVLGLLKTTYFNLTALRFTQVNYGVNILKVRCIGSGLHITLVTAFFTIFLDGPVLVYLKLNATSIL